MTDEEEESIKNFVRTIIRVFVKTHRNLHITIIKQLLVNIHFKIIGHTLFLVRLLKIKK